MIYEMRIYTLCPGGVQAWLDLYEAHALPALGKCSDMTLIGYFRAETGTLNRLVHIWAYADMQARDRAHRQLESDKDWLERFVLPARKYLVNQETTFMSPVGFSPLR